MVFLLKSSANNKASDDAGLPIVPYFSILSVTFCPPFSNAYGTNCINCCQCINQSDSNPSNFFFKAMGHTKSKQLKQGSDCIRKYGYFKMENRLYKILKLNLNFDLIVYEIG